MNKLTKENFNKAKDYIFTEGRALEREMFKFHFEKGSSRSVLNELARYQNCDGGFGNALEPDLRTPLSSALATSIALREMVKIGISDQNDILKNTVSYLLISLDQDKWRWIIAPIGRENSPHAPWWGAEDVVGAFRGCIANPTAEITGYLLNYKDLIPKGIIESLLGRLESYLDEATSSTSNFEMHDLMCYLALYHSKGLKDSTSEKFKPILVSQAKRIVDTEKEKWIEYGARPLWFCDSPNSMLYPHFEKSIQINLDFEIESQNENGSWSPFWSWEDYNSKDWPIAQKDWSSHLTLRNLFLFKNYGRLEE
ncbi:MAG: hypothetical protein R3B45_00075 [Bdellovibrionota bacterium]